MVCICTFTVVYVRLYAFDFFIQVTNGLFTISFFSFTAVESYYGILLIDDNKRRSCPVQCTHTHCLSRSKPKAKYMVFHLFFESDFRVLLQSSVCPVLCIRLLFLTLYLYSLNVCTLIQLKTLSMDLT